MTRRRIVINDDTGEIISKHKSDRFAMKFTEVWRYVYKSNLFTAAEERVLNRLAEYLQMNTNAVVNPNGSIMTIEDMARNISMNRSDIRRYIRQLVRKNALGVWKSGYDETYFMNPYLYIKGNIEPWLYERFEEEFGAKAIKGDGYKRFKAGKKKTSLVAVV